ncbi:MAG: RluA family pseudouridine synthase [Nitrospinales bacterium]
MSLPDLEILYLDNHLIAVYKPFGMLTQGDRSGAPSLFDLTKSHIKKEFAKPGRVFLGLLHRLDRPVAGVVLFARTSKAAGRLSQQFREKTVQKIYRAAVLGIPENKQGELTAYLKKERNLKATVYPRPTKDARQARLAYRVLDSLPGGCVLEVIPHTGRFHQIRAQLAFLGHPIIGDVKYRAPHPLPGRRIALYAQKLVFRHPVSGGETSVESPEPPDWPPAVPSGAGN